MHSPERAMYQLHCIVFNAFRLRTMVILCTAQCSHSDMPGMDILHDEVPWVFCSPCFLLSKAHCDDIVLPSWSNVFRGVWNGYTAGCSYFIQSMGEKIKQYLYMPGQALRVPGGRGSQISRESAHEGGKVVSPKHRLTLPPRKYSWYSFLLRGWVDPRAIVRPEGLCH